MNRPQWVCRNILSAVDAKFVTMYTALLSTLIGLQVLIETYSEINAFKYLSFMKTVYMFVIYVFTSKM